MKAFKQIAAGYCADEKTALFSGAAAKAYRLQVSGGTSASARRRGSDPAPKPWHSPPYRC
jgi:hypothetical protein